MIKCVSFRCKYNYKNKYNAFAKRNVENNLLLVHNAGLTLPCATRVL
jgi:hypothetical protein